MALEIVGQRFEGSRGIPDVPEGADALVTHARIAVHRFVHGAECSLCGRARVPDGRRERFDLRVDLRQGLPRFDEEPAHLDERRIGVRTDGIELRISALAHYLGALDPPTV